MSNLQRYSDLGKLTGGLSLEGLKKYLDAVLKNLCGNQLERRRRQKSCGCEMLKRQRTESRDDGLRERVRCEMENGLLNTYFNIRVLFVAYEVYERYPL